MRVLLFWCGLAAAAAVAGQDPAATAAKLNAEAVKAYQAKDYAQFLAYEKQAVELDPRNPQVLYNVACGEALQGNASEAVHFLTQLLAQKLDFGAETDPDFAKVRGTPQWASFLAALADLRKPVVHSTVAFTIPDPNFAATGIAADPVSGDFFVASVRERKIIRRSRSGAISDFIRSGQDGFMAGDSLAVDPGRRLLFATVSAAPYMQGYQKEDFGRSGIFVFDLKSGKLVRKAMLKPDGKLHLLNALALNRDGDAYISDTGASGIYRLRNGSADLEEFIPASEFRATQGLALSEDEKTLYVADYATGLWALDLASKEKHEVRVPEGVWLRGLDGISRVPGGLIAVQIGPKPERVLRIELDAKATRVTNVEILEMSHPNYEGPIQGTIQDQAFFYVANSQLDLGDPKTGAYASERAHPTVVLRLPL